MHVQISSARGFAIGTVNRSSKTTCFVLWEEDGVWDLLESIYDALSIHRTLSTDIDLSS